MESLAPQQTLHDHLAAEVALLAVTQAYQTMALARGGLLDDEKVPLIELERGLPPHAAFRSSMDFNNTETKTYSLCYGPIEGRRLDIFHYIDVAEEIGETLVPLKSFTESDALLVKEMVNGLQAAKAAGLLPHLSKDCLGIVGARE